MARPTDYETKKKSHNVRVTDTGWQGFRQAAETLGLSASELIERIGRGTLAEADVKKVLLRG
jgi:hypothetical protein